MKQNHLNGKNGFHVESFLRKHKKEFPILSSLKFIKPFVTKRDSNKRGKWNIVVQKRKVGIYVVKDKKLCRFVKVGIARYCLYTRVFRYIQNNAKNPSDCLVAFVTSGSIKGLNKFKKLLIKEVVNVPIYDTVDKFKPFLVGKKQIPFSSFNFRSPFEKNKSKEGGKIYTFEGLVEQRGGVYVIMENDEVVYIGRSYGHLVGRMYHHFYPSSDHSLVEYSESLDVHNYKVALIEVPSVGKSSDCFRKEIRNLEEALIQKLNPRDNTVGKDASEGDEEYPWQKEMEEMQKLYAKDGDEPPF